MALTLSDKLKIKEGASLFTINAPRGFKKSLGALPAKTKITDDPAQATQLHWFVTNRAQLEQELKGVLKLLKGEMVLWIYYPKGTSGIQTDLTRDKGWDALLQQKNLSWLSLISFDDTWSTFAMRLKTGADVKKESNTKPREIFDYIDPVKKTVRVPDLLAGAFKKNKKAEALFNALSYSCRKEYVEWIITAKRDETKTERVKGTLERLEKGWKNPFNN